LCACVNRLIVFIVFIVFGAKPEWLL
jgi:hypothetical protein